MILTPVLKASFALPQEIQRVMTRYCSDKPVKADKSLEQEVVRQRDVAELKNHALKTKLINAKHTNKMVRCYGHTFDGSVGHVD